MHLFEDPAWRGVAEYRAGRYRRALAALVLDETAESLYNMGNAYAQLHEWAGAKAAYRKVLTLDPAHEDASYNLALVERAEAAEARLEEESRSTRRLGRWEDGNRTEPERDAENAEKTVRAEVNEGRSTPTAVRTDASGRSDAPGQLGTEALAKNPQAGIGVASADAGQTELAASSGVATIRRESAQAAELLLRAISDDPARVLAARLRQVDRLRRERERQ